MGIFYVHQGHEYLNNARRIQMQVYLRPRSSQQGAKVLEEKVGEMGRAGGGLSLETRAATGAKRKLVQESSYHFNNQDQGNLSLSDVEVL